MRRAHPATDIRALAHTEQLILRLLREHGETYGLRLVALSGGELTQGGVYVTLGRMETKGYVESWVAMLPGFTGPPRRLYRPTAHGLRMLEAQEAFARAVSGEKRGA
jgi:DNA-binding PadR family transcriptional regulator